MGIQGHLLSTSKELELSGTLSTLDLDSNHTHLIHIVEISEIDVQVTLKSKAKGEKILMFPVDLDETFDQLLLKVESKESDESGVDIMDSLCLCHKSATDSSKPREADGKKVIASTCITHCELVALNKADKGKYEKKSMAQVAPAKNQKGKRK